MISNKWLSAKLIFDKKKEHISTELAVFSFGNSCVFGVNGGRKNKRSFFTSLETLHIRCLRHTYSARGRRRVISWYRFFFCRRRERNIDNYHFFRRVEHARRQAVSFPLSTNVPWTNGDFSTTPRPLSCVRDDYSVLKEFTSTANEQNRRTEKSCIRFAVSLNTITRLCAQSIAPEVSNVCRTARRALRVPYDFAQVFPSRITVNSPKRKLMDSDVEVQPEIIWPNLRGSPISINPRSRQTYETRPPVNPALLACENFPRIIFKYKTTGTRVVIFSPNS